MRAALICAAAMLIVAPASAARTVTYPIDGAMLAKDGAEQGLVPSPSPAKGPRQIALQFEPGVDHEVMRVGIACSAWKVDNPISGLIRDMMAAHDADGRLDPPGTTPTALAITIKHASTLSRCITTGDLGGDCITRVSIDASVSEGTEGKARPIHAEVEQATKSLGLCAGLTRGIGLVSREAVIKLIAAADTPSS